MKDVEGWGGGVSRYFEKCDELGLPPPKVEELDGALQVPEPADPSGLPPKPDDGDMPF